MDASRSMPDRDYIGTASRTGERAFIPGDAMALHAAHRAFIERALQAAGPERRVVVTHHLPSARSLDPAHAGKGEACYASDREDTVGRLEPAAWIHGHTHKASDYLIGRTRIACMPKGDCPEDYTPFENEGFRATFVIEI